MACVFMLSSQLPSLPASLSVAVPDALFNCASGFAALCDLDR